MVSVVFFKPEYSVFITAGASGVFQAIAVGTCCAVLSTRVSADRQGRVMGNNQALFVGGEALGAFAGGAIASFFIPLPLVVFGIISIVAGLLLFTVNNE